MENTGFDKTVQDVINKTDVESVKMLSWMYKHAWIKTLVLFVLGLYIVLSPRIPMFVVKLYASKIFKFLVVLLILFLSAHDVQLAVMVSIVYLLTVHRISCGNEYFTDSDGNPRPPPPDGSPRPQPDGSPRPQPDGSPRPRQEPTGSHPPCPAYCMGASTGGTVAVGDDTKTQRFAAAV